MSADAIRLLRLEHERQVARETVAELLGEADVDGRLLDDDLDLDDAIRRLGKQRDENGDNYGRVLLEKADVEFALACRTEERDASEAQMNDAATALLASVGRDEPDTDLWTAVTDVLAALAEAAEDSARLDFVDAHVDERFGIGYEMEPSDYVSARGFDVEWPEKTCMGGSDGHRSIRDAIDAWRRSDRDLVDTPPWAESEDVSDG